MNKRYKNYAMWIGVLATLLAAANIDAQTLTSWTLLKDAIFGVFQNPYIIGCCVIAILGQINNPTTRNKGFKDDKY